MNELDLVKHAANWAARHVPAAHITGFGYWITGEISRDARYVELSDWPTLYDRYLESENPTTRKPEAYIRRV